MVTGMLATPLGAAVRSKEKSFCSGPQSAARAGTDKADNDRSAAAKVSRCEVPHVTPMVAPFSCHARAAGPRL